MEQSAVLLTPDWEITREDLAWAAGFFEGEGSIGIGRYKGTSSGVWPNLNITNTDTEILQRFVAMFQGMGTVYKHSRKDLSHQPKSNKPVYVWRASGFEYYQAIGAMLWPWLGSRRRQRFAEILQEVLTYQRQRNIQPKGLPCKINTCKGLSTKLGFCKKHYKEDLRFRHCRDGKICAIAGCNDAVDYNDICRHHINWLSYRKIKNWRVEDGILICE